jgi:hypothetical protein
MVLGDSAVIFLVEQTGAFKPFLDKEDIPRAVFLPVSSSRVLVGSSSTNSLSFDPASVGLHVARCSFDFFIGASDSAANSELMNEIRAEALPLSDEVIDQVIAEIIENEL